MAGDAILPPGAVADWTIAQEWARCSAEKHAMWDRLETVA